MVDPIPYKRHLVAKLYLGKLMSENTEVPRDAQWKDVKEIDKDVQGPFGLVWGKDEHGTVAQLFYFKKFPHWYYANQADLAGGVTHYIFIGE